MRQVNDIDQLKGETRDKAYIMLCGLELGIYPHWKLPKEVEPINFPRYVHGTTLTRTTFMHCLLPSVGKLSLEAIAMFFTSYNLMKDSQEQYVRAYIVVPSETFITPDVKEYTDKLQMLVTVIPTSKANIWKIPSRDSFEEALHTFKSECAQHIKLYFMTHGPLSIIDKVKTDCPSISMSIIVRVEHEWHQCIRSLAIAWMYESFGNIMGWKVDSPKLHRSRSAPSGSIRCASMSVLPKK